MLSSPHCPPPSSIDKLSVVFAVFLAILIFEEKVSFTHGIGIFLIALGSLIIALW